MMEYAQRKKTATAVKRAEGTAREPIRQPGRAAYTQTTPAIGLDAQLRERFRERFGKITDGVRVIRDPALAPEGETAYARGDEIHIADGVRQDSDFGARVLEHEFGHIVQQRMGLANGGGLLNDSALERSAEHMPPTDAAPLQAELAPVQMFPGPFSQYKPAWLSSEKPDRLFRKLTPNMKRYGKILEAQQRPHPKISPRDASNEAFRQLGIMRTTLNTAYTDDAICSHPRLNSFSEDLKGQERDQLGMLDKIPEYADGIARLRNQFDSLPPLAELSNPQVEIEAQLNMLGLLERDLAEFQSEQFYGAAYDSKFKQLQDEVQQRYEDLFAWSIQLGLPFPRPQSLGAKQTDRAQQTWESILTGASRIVIDPNETMPDPNKAPSATNQLFAVSSIDYRAHPEQANQGFNKRALANLGRLLRTPTGEELLRGFTAPPPQTPMIAPDAGISARELARREHLVVIKATAPDDGKYRRISTAPTTIPLCLAADGTMGKEDPDHSNLPAFIHEEDIPGRTAGMGAIVYTPGTERDSENVTVTTDGTPVLDLQPVIMGHELIHASHYQKGLSPRHYKAPEVGALYKNAEEYVTMTGQLTPSLLRQIPQPQRGALVESAGQVNEARLRRDLGLKMRDYHDASVAFKV